MSITYLEAIREAQSLALEKYDDVFIYGQDIGSFGGAFKSTKGLYDEFPEREVHRCGFLSLPIDGYVGAHIDEGTYYLTRDRYHLSIAGQYQYFVGNETAIVDPGTLFWFNNKMPHGAVNLGEETRITFVFDLPHGNS